ncbi:hypothetical protein DPMN_043717 [Dreissena polymorpha]|uniref:Uncharacterized protein n=1 Tax=Dreissena polymorpha TaxID=45954 RepID=A0A9D4HY41_DREPO|nr:hypothetical protein DPMN_043717 [Dreissena polymorpha]
MNNKWPPCGHVFFSRAEPFLNSSKICPKFMKIMYSRLFSCFHYIHIKKTAPLPANNMTSRVKKTPPGGHVFFIDPNHFQTQLSYEGVDGYEKKNPPGGHVFFIDPNHYQTQLSYPGVFIFAHLKKNAPPTGSDVFLPIPTIFKLLRDINKTNVLTNFHDDWAKIVTSRVFTRENCHYIHIEKNAPPTGGHVFSPILTIFELV